MSTTAVDLAVVGGGIIGLSIARAAARRGLSVTLLERDRPGRAASRAAAGILGPQLEARQPGPLLTLGLASRALYPAFLHELRQESGIDADLRSEGTLLTARSADGLAGLERLAAFQSEAGLRLALLPPDEVLRREPSLAPGIAAGLHLPDDVSLDSARLLQALQRGARLAGVEIRGGSPVTRVTTAAGRVTGVEMAGGSLAAGAVVVAAGAWTAQVAVAGDRPLPSHPVRGQSL